jgi:hypothetical protein
MTSREERIAQNEALCRELNERKFRWLRRGLSAAGFRCECWELECGARIQLSTKEWKEARAEPNRFVVVPEHVARDVETVVKRYPSFWLVEKDGDAGKLVQRLDEETG